MNQTFDTLIIGAGPAGTFLAYKLAKAGLKTIVLEKSVTPKRKVCGEYLCPLGVDLLKREGLEDQIVGRFLPLQGMLIVTAKGTKLDTAFPQPEKFHGVSVDREQFDSNLMNLAKSAGAQINTGVEVKKITQQGDLWIVETTIGRFVSRVLVGADGRASIVSKTFQNDIPSDHRRVALHALINSTSKNLRRGEMHLFSNGAYIGINPTGETEVNFSLVMDAEELRKLGGPTSALNHYLTKSVDLSTRFPKFESTDKITAAFPIQHRTKSIIPRYNVALIGDAAGFVDPLTGEGMYNALLSASLLAEEMILDLKRNLIISKNAFLNYKMHYSKVLNHKMRLNRAFQVIIYYPIIVELMARFLLTKQARADIFIGIIGNIYSPIQGILKLITNYRSTL